MNTSEFAKMCGVEKRTLFHYDAMGLVKPARVPENGYREYSMEQLGLMDMIKIFQACGYSLSEIREMIGDGEKAKVGHVRNALDRIDARIAQLQQMKGYLQSKQQLLAEYQALPVGSCRIGELSLRQERKPVSSDQHFFSFLRDGTFSSFLLDRNGNCFICRASETGKDWVSGTAISFFLEIPSSEDRLPQLIQQQLQQFGFSGEPDFFLESLPHFLLNDPKSAVLKVTVFEKQAP